MMMAFLVNEISHGKIELVETIMADLST